MSQDHSITIHFHVHGDGTNKHKLVKTDALNLDGSTLGDLAAQIWAAGDLLSVKALQAINDAGAVVAQNSGVDSE